MSAAETINYPHDRSIRALAQALPGPYDYTRDVEIHPVVAADLRRDQFQKIEDWPEDAPSPLDELTDATLDVVGLAALGLSGAEIGRRRYTSE